MMMMGILGTVTKMGTLGTATFGVSFIGAALLAFAVPILVLFIFLTFSESIDLAPSGGLAAAIHVMYRLIAIYAAAAVAGGAVSQVFKSQDESPFNYPPLLQGGVAGALAGSGVAVVVIAVTLFGERVTEAIYETISFGAVDL